MTVEERDTVAPQVPGSKSDGGGGEDDDGAGGGGGGEAKPKPAERPRERLNSKVVVAAALLFIVAFLFYVFVTSTDRVLAGYHKPGETAGGPVQLTAGPVGEHWLALDVFKDRVDKWRGFECVNRASAQLQSADPSKSSPQPCPEQRDTPTKRWQEPGMLLTWFFVGDVLFARVYTVALVLLWAAFRERRWRNEQRVEQEKKLGMKPTVELDPRLRSSGWVLASVLLAGAADIAEDAVIGSAASTALNGETPPSWTLLVGSALGWIKWTCIIFVAAVYGFSWLRGAWTARRTVAGRVGAAALVVALVAVLVRVPQAEDGLRRMSGLQLFGSIVAAMFVGVVTAVAGSRALEHRPDAYPKDVDGAGYKKPQWWFGWWVGVLGGLLIAFGLVTPYRGIVLPGGLLVILCVLSFFVNTKFDTAQGAVGNTAAKAALDDHDVLNDWSRTAAALGAMVPLLVGAGALMAYTVDPLPRRDVTASTTSVVPLMVAAAILTTIFCLVTYGAGLAVIEHLGAANAKWKPDTRRKWARGLTAFVGTISLVALVLAHTSAAEGLAQNFGSMTVVLVFAFVVASLAVVCRTTSDALLKRRWAVPAALKSLDVGRPPLLFAVVLWLVIGLVLPQGKVHDVRELADAPVIKPPPDAPPGTGQASPETGVEAEAYTGQWKRVIEAKLPRPTPVRDRDDIPAPPPRQTPVVLVAASGGGIRASYWTSAVLDCIFDRTDGTPDQRQDDFVPVPDHCQANAPNADRRKFLFSASSASGGSLGVMQWLSYLEKNPTAPGSRSWFDTVHEGDFLAPTLSSMLLVDGPNLWLRDQDAHDRDRAAALERAWEDAWSPIDGGSSPLAQGFAARQGSFAEPMVVLNSASAADGCKFNVSVLNLSVHPKEGNKDAALSSGCRGLSDDSTVPGSIDLTDWQFCNQQPDIRRSTAALLSARFPYVTPSGWLAGCRDNSRTFLVDGGYIDTSGASTLVDLWNKRVKKALCPGEGVCEYVPVFVQIDNDPNDTIGPLPPAPRPADSPNELMVPPGAIQAASGGWASASRADACLQFNKRSQDGYWIRLAVGEQPGAPPPLGWVLSDQTREALRVELNRTDNADRIKWLQDWLDHPDTGPGTKPPQEQC